MKGKFSICILMMCCITIESFGQLNQYKYKRTLDGITDNWHRLTLPDDVYAKVSNDLSDIRIIGIDEDGDTVEVPYLINLATDKTTVEPVNFNLINPSTKDGKWFFTLEVPTKESINQIELEFNLPNFDWKLTLEGSQDQKEWFHVVKDYRILSIKNNLTDYHFTTVNFPPSIFAFYRISIKSPVNPSYRGAKISLKKEVPATYKNFQVKTIKSIQSKSKEGSIIEVGLNAKLPVSFVKVVIKDKIDYYRPVKIQYLTDSIQTDKGWKYNYRTLTSGTLSSLENNEFKFKSTTLKKLKFIVVNADNEPLTIEKVEVRGYEHELVARFTNPGKYYLLYGNSSASVPKYDISRFKDKIPANLTNLKIGPEEIAGSSKAEGSKPLFSNPLWMWAILLFIILILGYFSFTMIRK